MSFDFLKVRQNRSLHENFHRAGAYRTMDLGEDVK